MARILAIDPGCLSSASLIYSTESGLPCEAQIQTNGSLLGRLATYRDCTDLMAIEMVASYGMPVGREVFETCVWIGKFIDRYMHASVYIYRGDVKMHLCHSMRATDANVRAALIDKFGPGREIAIGTKKKPGPLYGISKDLWSALAVAVTASAKPEA